MEQLLCREFDGVLEHIAWDAEGNIGIRMLCSSQTFVYFDENDDNYERKETEPVNKKVFVVIYCGELEWGDPVLCKRGDKVFLRRWLLTPEFDHVKTPEWHYGLTNKTLESEDEKSEYVWLNSII